MSLIKLIVLAVTVALPGVIWAQAPRAQTRAGAMESLVRPPIPSDPSEPVMGDAEAVQTPEERQAATALLDHAHALSNVRAQPYDLKTTFTSFGSSPSDGAWSLEDISPARNVYRWTAQGPAIPRSICITIAFFTAISPREPSPCGSPRSVKPFSSSIRQPAPTCLSARPPDI